MKSKLLLFPSFLLLILLLFSGFSDSEKQLLHADEGNILNFEYTNFDGGLQYMNDHDTALFPFVNKSGHDITILRIVSKNKYDSSPYKLIYPESRFTIKDKQRDTIFFVRENNGDIKDGRYDHAWVIDFAGIEKKQYLNIFCELRHNNGALDAENIVLPTVPRGENILFERVVTNTGYDTVEIRPLYEWNDNCLTPLETDPIRIAPGQSETLHFELETERLFKNYSQWVYIDANSEEHEWVAFNYSGTLISDCDPTIDFDSTALTLNICQGDPAEYEFWFTNNGTAPLVISMVKTSCGCLVPSYYPKEPVPPGARNVIKIRYDTSRVGPISKTATVTTNVSDYPVVLRVLGSVSAL